MKRPEVLKSPLGDPTSPQEMEAWREWNLFVLGGGVLARAIVDHVVSHRRHMREWSGVELQIAGGTDEAIMQRVEGCGRHGERGIRTAGEFLSAPLPRRVVVDCSADVEMGKVYETMLDRSPCWVLTANLRAILRYWRWERRSWSRRVLADAALGFGLPLISTLRDLVMSGDTVLRLEMIVPATLDLSREEVFRLLSDLSGVAGFQSAHVTIDRRDAYCAAIFTSGCTMQENSIPPSLLAASVDTTSSEITVAITTRRYRLNPMVLQAPCPTVAGLAQSLLAELLRTCEREHRVDGSFSAHACGAHA
jgi:hypothetical protein